MARMASKRSHGAVERLPDPCPQAAAAAAAVAPSESNPIRWGPPPLEPIPIIDPRDSVFAAATLEDKPTADAVTKARSTLSLMPRCLAVAARANR